MKVLVAVGVVVAAGILQAASAGGQTIKASTEAGGKQHPATAKITTPVSITCTKVSGTNASCYFTGPNMDKQVQKDFKVLISQAGTVKLTCNGTGAVTCEAQIDPAPKEDQ